MNCKISFAIILLIFSIGLCVCEEKTQSSTGFVEIKDFSFQPGSITVPLGTDVAWVNRDPVEHTITAADGSFDSGNIDSGQKFNWTFSKAGTFQYQCLIHPSMVGEVIVTEETPVKPNFAKMDDPQARDPLVRLKLVADGFQAPMEFISAADGTGRMFAVDQTGVVKIVTADGKLLDEPFLDISDQMVEISPSYDERGLLGLTFHPNYAQNGRLFVFYSAPLREEAPSGWSCTNRLSEFQVSADDPNKVNMSSEKVLLQVDKPQMNHNGGTITFGPDGYLYIPLGDGGGANDVGEGHAPDGNAQNTSTLLGKILRIDVNDASTSYSIPQDNPFIGQKGFLPEIWAYGLRNPWRISFDADGRLFVSDAGQNLWEEVDLVTKGGNYGWNIREGTHCFDPKNPNQSPASCSDKGALGETLISPVIEYDHNNRTVVVGGYIYHGKAILDWSGSYIFGDWSSSFKKGDGTLLIGSPDQASSQNLWSVTPMTIAGSANGKVNAFIRAFGQDDEGELYVLTSDQAGPSGGTGKIYKLVAPSS